MNEQGPVFALYEKLIEAWNQRDADAFSNLFQGKGEIVGFDGTRVMGRKEIQGHLQDVFSKDQTPPYIAAAQRVHSIKSGVVSLSAKAGMKTGDDADFHQDLWSEQSLVTVKTKDGWKIALFQNTPATLSGDSERKRIWVEEFHEALASNATLKASSKRRPSRALSSDAETS